MPESDTLLNIDNIAANCIGLRVRMLNRLVTNLYDEGLRPFGLKVSQVNILVATWKLGTARPAEMCKVLQMDVSTLSRNVDRMKARGWLETMPDPDGRAQPFKLTAQGRDVLEKILPVWREIQDKAITLLGAETLDWLNRSVRQLSSQAK
ncbi:MAG: MarR family transcriptional regulator [Gammaproteobacteria bacterium]|nr:MarR family transcriptional regulator [Gammaproteobacteria bacterium]